MHELGIATSILETAQREASLRPGSHVVKVGLRIGEWAGVDPEALRFSFEALVNGYQPTPPSLEIEFLARQNHCRACGMVFVLIGFDVECPRCRAPVTEPASGDELELAYVELEEP